MAYGCRRVAWWLRNNWKHSRCDAILSALEKSCIVPQKIVAHAASSVAGISFRESVAAGVLDFPIETV